MRLSVLFLSFFLLCSSFAYATPNLVVDYPSSIDEGDNITITFYLERNNTNISAWKVYYLTHNKVSLNNHTITDAWNGSFSETSLNDNGSLKAQTFKTNDLSSLPSKIYIINFTSTDSGTASFSYYFQCEDLSLTKYIFSDIFTIDIEGEDPPNNGGNGGSNNGGGNPPPPPPPDSDNDGVPDSSDICPGYDDNIDSDNDTIPDGCDDTPYGDPEPPQNDTNTTEPPINESLLNAIITFDNRTYKVGERVNFSAKDSTGDIHYYHWEFGDGVAVEKVIKAHNEYENPGNYTITLTISDNKGNTSQAFVNVTILPKPYVPPTPEPKEEDSTIPIIVLIGGIIVFLILFRKLRKQGLI